MHAICGIKDSFRRDDIDTIIEYRTGKTFDEPEDDWLADLDEKEDIYWNVNTMTPTPTPRPFSKFC